MKKKLFFLCALCALLALALPALGERVELLDGRITVELPEGIDFAVRGSVTEEQALNFPALLYGQELEDYMEDMGYLLYAYQRDSGDGFYVSIDYSDTGNGLVGTDLTELAESAKEYEEWSAGKGTARIYLHRQLPFYIFDAVYEDPSGVFVSSFSRSYSTMYRGYSVDIGCMSDTNSWGDSQDAILISMVDSLEFFGLPDYHTALIDENLLGGEKEIIGGMKLVLPQEWMDLSVEGEENLGFYSFVRGGASLDIQIIDLYGSYTAISPEIKRSDIYLGSDFYPFDTSLSLISTLGDALNSDFAASAIARLITGRAMPSEVFMPEIEIAEGGCEGERMEINGIPFYHMRKRFLGTIDNDVVLCKDFSYTVDVYTTALDGRVYNFIGEVYYKDADTSGIPEIMQSVTFVQ